MAKMKVLISGCGVGGPALALWLARIGADITVVERAPHLRATGQQIDIRGQGIPLLAKMGIQEEVKEVVTKEPGAQLINTYGKTMAFFPADPQSDTKQGLSSEYEIMRGDLIHILQGATKNHKAVRYLFGKSIDSFTQDDIADPNGKVHVLFSDGQTEDYDLLVGADGARSRIRRLMLGLSNPDALESQNAHFAFFSIPARPGDSNRWTICFLPERAVLSSRKDHPDYLRAYMIIHGKYPSLDAAYESNDKAQLKKAWSDLFAGRGWEADRFLHELEHSRVAEDLYAGPINFVKLPEGGWNKGRVTLLGDAACSSTLNGKGTTVALAGAYVLAGEIATLLDAGETLHRTIVQGTANYEKTLRPLVKIAQTTSKGGFGSNLPQTWWQIYLLWFVAWLAALFRLDKWGWLTSDNLDQWQLPEYRVLDQKRV
ncbi:hypothetical protein PG989_000434 [Apiospora arundinis]